MIYVKQIKNSNLYIIGFSFNKIMQPCYAVEKSEISNFN
jgi:hypothetical protein